MDNSVKVWVEHDETDSLDNPGIFKGLMDFVASLDGVLQKHLKTANIFKDMSKTVKMSCMLWVINDYIQEKVKDCDFISCHADETSDISSHCQLVLRYIDTNSNIQERFI